MLTLSAPRSRHIHALSPHGFARVAYHEWGKPDNPRVVICVHGLARTDTSLAPMAMALKAYGYRVLNWSYPSTKAAPEELVAAVAKRRNFPVEARVPLREIPRITWEAMPALLMPVILLGCLYSGITTPTEAAAVAAAYALLPADELARRFRLENVAHSAGVFDEAVVRAEAVGVVAVGLLDPAGQHALPVAHRHTNAASAVHQRGEPFIDVRAAALARVAQVRKFAVYAHGLP